MREHGTRSAIRRAALLLAVTSSAAIAGPRAQFVFNQPAEPLSRALRDVAIRTGENVIAPQGLVEAREAPALSGRFTAQQALGILLQGSGLDVRLVQGNLVVELASAEPGEGNQGPQGITVTGTRIRGAGSASPMRVTTRHALEQAGINDLADFTRVLPENYGGGQNRGIPGGGEQGGQENLNDSANLNLRGLGPDATLTLLNGHRLSYDGLDQGIDLSAIPLGAIDRVEIVADGASALYGSDAVAGVANIILRPDYDGLEATARLGGSTSGGGFQKEFSLVGGRRWSSGGFMATLDASGASPIYAGQRDFTRTVDSSLTLTNRIRQLSGVVSGHQQIARGLSVDLDAYLTDRRSLLQDPFLPGTDVHVSGLVSHNHLRSWAATPSLRADLGPWLASVSATLADSHTLLSTENYFESVPKTGHLLYEDNLKGIEATAEGPLFTLPGGDARLAVGGGLRNIALHQRYLFLTAGQWQSTKDVSDSRNVQFAYGEVSLPLVRPDLHVPLVDKLSLSAALRYEHWNHIAAETTPKLGLIYQPVPDVTVRATWGKSFKIPTLLQLSEIQQGVLLPGFYFVPGPRPAGSTVLLLAGTAPNLRPEHATTWSTTLELRPRLVPGLALRASYFKVDYRDRIAAPMTSLLSALYNPLYSGFITYDPSAAQVNAVVAALPEGLSNQTGLPFDPSAVGAIVDDSIRNTERQRIHGVDLGGDYHLDLGASEKLWLTAAASYLASGQQLAAGQPLVPLAGTIFHPPHWRGRAGIGWDTKSTSLNAFLNYVGRTIDNSYATPEPVGAFVTLDLNASLRTGNRAGPLRNLELRLSALNLLNEKPHPIRVVYPEEAPYDSTNESPVGRFLGASIRKIW